MITLLASIAGFISSIIPEILKLLKDQSDKRHELRIFDRQVEYTKHSQSGAFEKINLSKDMLEQASLYSTYKSGIYWIDALNSSVRPILAYCFFLMYATVKFAQYRSITTTAPIVEYIDVIWSIDDQAIFAGIISFYFGQRTFSKIWNCKA